MGKGHHAPVRRPGTPRRVLAFVALVAAIASLLGSFTASPVQAASTIETQYKATGSWAVSTANATDSGGRTFVLYYPTNLGAGGVDHPIVTWGNGTNASPSNYTGILNHLASWGFVVVASTSGTTGNGDLVLAGANYMVGQNSVSSSRFYQNLDVTKVAAMGHSQGASGALNATTKSNGLITSTMVFNLPNDVWISSGDKTNWSQIVKPVFFVTGSNDSFISSASGNTAHYNKVAGAAAKAVLKGAGHNTVQGSGGGFLGYEVAWLLYTLKGDTFARGAFAGSAPEINGNTNWQNQAEKNLP
jgi:hypothetical protein